MFQNETDQVMDDRVKRPLPEQPKESSFSLWKLMSAPVRGVATGGFEAGASGSDIMHAYGKTVAGYGSLADPSLLFDQKEFDLRKEAGQESRDQIQTGEAFSSETGDTLREKAKLFAPDPATASKAEQLVFGFSRAASKAIGYSALAGPVVGSVMFGTDEGLTTSSELKDQGVDFGTRTGVAVVHGVASAAQVALPAAGNTVGQTVGLAVAGGPVAYVAEMQATKQILQNAGQEQLASQYDPFDPVGLSVSTLLPFAFGGLVHYTRANGAKAGKAAEIQTDPALVKKLSEMDVSVRRNMKYNDPSLDAYAVHAATREGIPPEALLAIKNAGERSNSTQVSSANAKGVMQFIKSTWDAFGRGDITDPINSIDAGAKFLKTLIKQYKGNVRAAIAHYNGGDAAGRAVMEGRLPPAAETRNYLKRTDEFMAGHVAKRAVSETPELVDAARVQLVKETVDSWNLADPKDIRAANDHLSAILKATDQIGYGRNVEVAANVEKLSQARVLDEFINRFETTRASLVEDTAQVLDRKGVSAIKEKITGLETEMKSFSVKDMAREFQTTEKLKFRDAMIKAQKTVDTRINDIQKKIDGYTRRLNASENAYKTSSELREIDAAINHAKAARQSLDVPTPKASALAVKQAIDGFGVQDVPKEVFRPEIATTARKEPVIAREAGVSKYPETGLNERVSEIERLAPDMLVHIEGMDQPVKLSEAMEAVRNEAARDVKDIPLIQAAAECFLRTAE